MDQYKKSSTALHAYRVMCEMRKLRRELHEHRYYLERKVAKQTESLTRRIDLLELCNDTLCRKLANSEREMAELHKAAADMLPRAA